LPFSQKLSVEFIFGLCKRERSQKESFSIAFSAVTATKQNFSSESDPSRREREQKDSISTAASTGVAVCCIFLTHPKVTFKGDHWKEISTTRSLVDW
jgi:hypothetical protein